MSRKSTSSGPQFHWPEARKRLLEAELRLNLQDQLRVRSSAFSHLCGPESGTSHSIRKRDRRGRSTEPTPQCCSCAVSFRIDEGPSSARGASSRTYCV